MLRSISILLAGLAIGLVAGVYYFTSPPDFTTQADTRPAGSANQSSAAQASAGQAATKLHQTGISSHQQRLDFYQRAALANATDLAAMITEVAATPDSPARRFAAETLLSRYAEIDPRNALATAHRFQFGTAVTAAVYAVWARSDPDAALAAIAIEPGSRIARSAGLLLVEELGGDSSALLDVLDALPAHIDRLGFQIEVLAAQSIYDPTAAISSASNFAQPADRERAMRRIARKLALQDPRLAVSAGAQIADKGSRLTFQAEVMREWAATDPAAAMSWLGQYQGEPGYEGALGLIAQQIAQNDPVSAARNIERYPDANNAAMIARTAGREWARRDPHSAAEWAANIGDAQVRDIAIANVARQWAGQDATSAARWALGLPAGNARDNALAAAVAGLASQGVPDEKLLNAFSNDMARQQAVVGAVYRLARTDRAAANRLMQKYVQDPTLRSQVEQNLASMVP